MWFLRLQARSEEDSVARRRRPVEAVIGRSKGRGGELGRSKNTFDAINVNVSLVINEDSDDQKRRKKNQKKSGAAAN